MSSPSTTTIAAPASLVIDYSWLYPVSSSSSSSVSASLNSHTSTRVTLFTSDAHNSLTTSYTHFHKRATSSDNNDSPSKTTSSLKSSTSACTDKQMCQTGSYVNGKTVGLAVAIPVIVFLSIIGFFMYKNYRKGKKEALDDNDPDFFGETTVLPDYPKGNGYYPDNDSFSTNPFHGENNYYPTGIIQQPASTHFPDNRSMVTARGDPYYDPFNIPYQHTTGSKQSLDEYAKYTQHGYSGYDYSRPTSRAVSGMNSPYRSPNSSSANLSQHVERQIEKSSSSNDEPTTESSASYHETKTNNDKDTGKDGDNGDNGDDVNSNFGQIDRDKALKALESKTTNDYDYHHYGESESKKEPEVQVKQTPESEDEEEEEQELEDIFKDRFEDTPRHHIRNLSDFSILENTSENLETQETKLKKSVKIESPKKDPEDEEDEDIKRMKSVYRVYFDRENSIRSVKKPIEDEDDDDDDDKVEVEHEKHVLPNSEELLPQSESSRSQAEPEIKIEEDEMIRQDPEDYLNVKNSNAKSLNPAQKGHRAVSSIYSFVPLPEESHHYQPQYHQEYQQDSQPQQYQQQPYQQHQRFPPQQAPSQQPQIPNIYQPPYQQQQRYPSSPSSPRIQIPQGQLPELQTVPTPSKMNYDSIVTNTEYAPTKSLTGGSRPDMPIKPFNPLHYSDQIFQPTSPISPSATGFGSYKEIQEPNVSDSIPPSPHHIRQSIVMVNPVEIGKQKIYRPAGSFTQYQQRTGGSRNGSLTSQSQYNAAYGQQESPKFNEFNPSIPSVNKDGELPRSGSQADLRKQLGTSDNYNFN